MSYLIHSAVQATQSIWKKASRVMLNLRTSFQPEAQRIAAERKLRGREQFRKLERADLVVVSFGKSGRTWLRVMLSRVYQQKHALPERALIGFDNFHSMNREVPKMFFTHDNYIGDYTGHTDSKVDFYGKKVVVLARDPRDVAVSQYFQWKYRMRPEKKKLNQYPGQGEEISQFDFLMNPNAGLLKVIEFMNLWAREASSMDDFFLLRYEDLKSRTEESLGSLLEFIGTPGNEQEITEAVRFSSVDNMKKMEQKKTFWLSGSRMVPGDRSNPHSYKVRRAKVGGFSDYFDDGQLAEINALVDENLDPVFGYTGT